MAEPMSLQVTTTPTYAVIAVSGEIDLCTAPTLRAAIDTLITAGTRHLVVDLDGVLFMGSTGLNTLVDVVRQLGAASLGVVVTRPHIRRIFTISGLDQLILLYDSVNCAIKAAPAPRQRA